MPRRIFGIRAGFPATRSVVTFAGAGAAPTERAAASATTITGPSARRPLRVTRFPMLSACYARVPPVRQGGTRVRAEAAPTHPPGLRDPHLQAERGDRAPAPRR